MLLRSHIVFVKNCEKMFLFLHRFYEQIPVVEVVHQRHLGSILFRVRDRILSFYKKAALCHVMQALFPF